MQDFLTCRRKNIFNPSQDYLQIQRTQLEFELFQIKNSVSLLQLPQIQVHSTMHC